MVALDNREIASGFGIFDQKKRSQVSPFKGIKKENIPYVKPLGLARGTVNC